MNESTQTSLEAALDELAAIAKRGGEPNRYHARELLVALGNALLGDTGDALEVEPEDLTASAPAGDVVPYLERALELGERLGPSWRAAARTELELACAEHVHSVDPRFLSLPNYDWDYTLSARQRLTARLAAAQRLGLDLPETLLARVEEADERLREHLR